MEPLGPRSDGIVTIRPSTAADTDDLVAGRDAESRRFLGDGAARPQPTACIVVGGAVVGWVDHDHERAWLAVDEVNVGYNVFPAHRGRGYATRAVRLLVEHLAEDTDWRVATLLIDPHNERSLAVARRAGFLRVGELDGNPYWKRLVAEQSTARLGQWSPLDIQSVDALFGPATFRWWVTGGHALEVHLGRSWRSHGDTDIGITRRDAPALHQLLAGWDLHIAAGGRLSPWRGEPLDADRSQNNVWCRRTPGDAWVLDVQVGDGDDRSWSYRRDPSLRLGWSEAVLASDDGVPYLAPDLQLLFKAERPRPKDDLDAWIVIPALTDDRAQRLGRLIDAGHPWHWWLRARPQPMPGPS